MNRALIALALVGCQDNLDAPLEQAQLDRPFFDCKVQPVLTKLCSALACHGDERRYFRVFSRNRWRITDDESTRNAIMDPVERDHNYAAALAVVDADEPERSPLLVKPLEQSAGGYFHVGATLYAKGNVFATTDGSDYQVLADWIAGATEATTCIEPGSTL